jgi:hypothetical protein
MNAKILDVLFRVSLPTWFLDSNTVRACLSHDNLTNIEILAQDRQMSDIQRLARESQFRRTPFTGHRERLPCSSDDVPPRIPATIASTRLP